MTYASINSKAHQLWADTKLVCMHLVGSLLGHFGPAGPAEGATLSTPNTHAWLGSFCSIVVAELGLSQGWMLVVMGTRSGTSCMPTSSHLTLWQHQHCARDSSQLNLLQLNLLGVCQQQLRAWHFAHPLIRALRATHMSTTTTNSCCGGLLPLLTLLRPIPLLSSCCMCSPCCVAQPPLHDSAPVCALSVPADGADCQPGTERQQCAAGALHSSAHGSGCGHPPHT